MSDSVSPRSLRKLLAGFGAPAPDVEVSGIEMDSRRVSPGDLFLACKGGGTHGLAHLEQALERGAAAVAWEPAQGWPQPEIGVPEIAIEQLSSRAGRIAARYYGEPSQRMYVCGVTGTDGKTSTAHLIAQALDRLGTRCAYVGTLGSGYVDALAKGARTTPDPVSLQKQLAHFVEMGAQATAMEVSSHALHQERTAGMKFDTAILTNVTRDHLDYHGTVENYAAAKRKLFEREELSALVLNRDDATGARWLQEFSERPVIAYGIDGDVPKAGRHVIVRKLRAHAGGLSFDIDSSWGALHIESRLLGRFNAYNLSAALAAILHRGLVTEKVAAALAQASTVPGRIEGFRGPAARPLVVVDYAHTPEALAQVLTAVRAHTAKKLWCVFGCGGDRDRGKRPLMGAAAARHADQLIVTDDNPRSEKPAAITAEILAGLSRGTAHRVIHDRAEAIRTAVSEAQADDVVVVAGKGHEAEQIYGTEVRPFSDRHFVAGLVGAPTPGGGARWNA
ncbi:MAG TPA: UDP-N-acetylmuramoyl-L-alanyl-D-glutamate--2,6-diaminopimelate ligase [Nevskiaceae bacterium]|nr:UDP-N-acetylmuramoyl-L-alanyl-D-glutamate--2,6-diaminopimelate ligase [Nevskiaceae bacterium]